MTIGALLLTCLLGPLPEAPSPAAFAEGIQLAKKGAVSPHVGARIMRRKEKASPEHITSPEARSLGWWFDGKEKLPVEQAIWMSPNLISRWLGWRQESEAWPADEVGNRWSDARLLLDGRSAFVIFLAAYPKKGSFGITEDEARNDRDLAPLRFRLKVDGIEKPVMISELDDSMGRTRTELERRPWWLSTPLAPVLAGGFDPESEDTLPLGSYRRKIIWIESEAVGEGSRVELSILSPHRTRQAIWKPVN